MGGVDRLGLEEDGHRVLIQAWDFVPGANWIQGMQAGTRDAARIIAILSTDYLTSVYGGTEWRAAWASDPEGTGRKLLTVRVVECDRPGLLAGVVGVDLFGLAAAEARARLRRMVSAAVAGRAKPEVPPKFPGTGRAMPRAARFPGAAPSTVEALVSRAASELQNGLVRDPHVVPSLPRRYVERSALLDELAALVVDRTAVGSRSRW